jgi:hypothetical protein
MYFLMEDAVFLSIHGEIRHLAFYCQVMLSSEVYGVVDLKS